MSGDLANGLHLPDLSISNFRGIKRLSVGRLGRVTLLAGRNGVGKTTVLEAVRVYAKRAHPSVLHELLEMRGEVSAGFDPDGDPILSPNYAALFCGRTLTQERPITIGPKSGMDDLRLEVSTSAEWSDRQRKLFADLPREANVLTVNVVYRNKNRILPWVYDASDLETKWPRPSYSRYWRRPSFDDGNWPVITCESLGPGLPENSKLARFWDRVALTEEEDLSLRALRLTYDGIERLALVGDMGSGYKGSYRRVVVKLKQHPRPVPLRSLGDGVTRLFAAALALTNSRGGFLAVDEAENGIHYSVQSAFWSMVLRAAQQHNVQVFATTHSRDCVIGFAKAAAQINQADGLLVRLERDGQHVRAVEYTQEDLVTAAEQGIEVR